jgi:signal transduction histidine kinase
MELSVDEARMCSHAVYFYDSDAGLSDRVGDFLGAGLRAGESAVVIATEPHLGLFVRRLEERHHEVGAARAAGRFVARSASETLGKLTVGAMPDAGLLKRMVGDLFDSIPNRGAGDKRPRVYGEMVDLLWKDGNAKAALGLEELWNDVGKAHSFDLLCGYATDHLFADPGAAPAVIDICDRHTDIVAPSRRGDDPTRWLVAEIAERRELERALRACARELRRSEQRQQAAAEEALRVRDEFLSLVSHELKTPLTVLQLQLHAWRNDAASDRDQRATQLRRATQSSDRLADLIESLMDVSSIATAGLVLTPKVFDLRESLTRLLDELRPAAERVGCVLSLRAGDPLLGSWDQKRVEQAVTNLVSNAIKHGAGKPVDVAIHRHGNEALIDVRDQGAGVPEAEIARIFGRFERASSARNYGGLGLGLYVVQEIARGHGGSVSVCNLVDKESGNVSGACFRLRLPIAAAVG